jgi:hypothetical protein
MQIRKIWLDQLKTFLTDIFKNIIWHLFAGESHQVVKITVTYSSYRWCASYASSTPAATAWIPSASAVFKPSGRRVLSRAEDSAAAAAATMKTGRRRPSADPASTRCLAAGDMGPAADSAAAAEEEVTAAVDSAAVLVAAAVVSAAVMAAAAGEVGDPGEDSAADLEAEVAAAVEDLAEAGAAEWDSAEADPTELLPVMYHQSICKLGNSLSV